jgi:hypothetical protein
MRRRLGDCASLLPSLLMQVLCHLPVAPFAIRMSHGARHSLHSRERCCSLP